MAVRRSVSVLDTLPPDTAFLSKEQLIQLIVNKLKGKTVEELNRILQTL